jgi:hypothetical protein
VIESFRRVLAALLAVSLGGCLAVPERDDGGAGAELSDEAVVTCVEDDFVGGLGPLWYHIADDVLVDLETEELVLGATSGNFVNLDLAPRPLAEGSGWLIEDLLLDSDANADLAIGWDGERSLVVGLSDVEVRLFDFADGGGNNLYPCPAGSCPDYPDDVRVDVSIRVEDGLVVAEMMLGESRWTIGEAPVPDDDLLLPTLYANAPSGMDVEGRIGRVTYCEPDVE